MALPDYDAWFEEYAGLYNAALEGRLDVRAVRDRFTPCFLGAGPSGVRCGRNGLLFSLVLRRGYAFYRRIGTRRMRVAGVEAAELYDGHDRVRVSWEADYVRPDGSELTIPFDTLYLLRREGGPKIFAFIAGDEMALYRRHGLVDARGRPVRA
jgi:hypothetical protein